MEQGQDKRQAILAAALEVIAEGGFHGAPAARIAERAGIGVGTIYRYFSDKDAVIHALYQEQERLFRQAMSATVVPGGDLRENFLRLGTELYRYFIGHPQRFRFMEQYYHSPYGASRKQEHYFGEAEAADGAPLVRLLRGGRAAGAVKNWPLALLFALTVGPLAHLLRDCQAGFITPDETQVQALLTAIWEAVRA